MTGGAHKRARGLTVVRGSTSAPSASSSRTTSVWPYSAAECRHVYQSCAHSEIASNSVRQLHEG